MKSTKLVLLLLLLITSALFAQTEESREIDTENLFDQIMQTLPAESREKVEAASEAEGVELPEHQNSVETEQRKNERRSASFDNLPPEVRERVEQTINDIDSRRERRMMEFRELNDR